MNACNKSEDFAKGENPAKCQLGKVINHRRTAGRGSASQKHRAIGAQSASPAKRRPYSK